MFSCVWLYFKKFFGKYFLVFGKEVGRGKTQKNTDKTQKNTARSRDRRHDLAIDGARSTIRVDRDRCGALRDRDRQRDLAKHRSRRSARCFAIDGAIGASRSTTRLWALSFSLARPQFRKSFEVKIGMKMNFRGQRYYFTVNWKWFPENSIFQTNQTAYFMENDFLKPFSPKTNTP